MYSQVTSQRACTETNY